MSGVVDGADGGQGARTVQIQITQSLLILWEVAVGTSSLAHKKVHSEMVKFIIKYDNAIGPIWKASTDRNKNIVKMRDKKKQDT